MQCSVIHTFACAATSTWNALIPSLDNSYLSNLRHQLFQEVLPVQFIFPDHSGTCGLMVWLLEWIVFIYNINVQHRLIVNMG